MGMKVFGVFVVDADNWHAGPPRLRRPLYSTLEDAEATIPPDVRNLAVPDHYAAKHGHVKDYRYFFIDELEVV